MELSGRRDWFLGVGIPHEVSHTIFATHFGRPTPRWADEGAAQLAESAEEQTKRHKVCVKILNGGSGIKLSHLFRLMEYPKTDLGKSALYAQGHSVTRWIVGFHGRPAFLAFIETGQRSGWDRAAESIGFASVEDLEEKWLEWLRDGAKLTSNDCKCGPSCVGESCQCGCQHSSPASDEDVNYWWIVPAAVVAGGAIKLRGDRRYAVA
jgi:hypothetical protein